MPDFPEFCEGEGLLRGARRISQFIFGTEEEWRSVDSLAHQLPISGSLGNRRRGHRISRKPLASASAPAWPHKKAKPHEPVPQTMSQQQAARPP